MLKECLSEIDQSDLNDFYIPKILELHNDVVPNVRFNIPKLLILCESMLSDENAGEATMILKNMYENDVDVDVKYFCHSSLLVGRFNTPEIKAMLEGGSSG